MMVLAALLAGCLAWWTLKSAIQANPAKLATMVRRGGGALAFLAALVLGLRGRWDMALLLAGAGFWFIGSDGGPASFLARLKGKPASVSRMRSAMIEMEVDHATGDLRGSVLAGTYQGRTLDGLGPADLRLLASACRRDDPDGERLLQAYLNRRFAAGRKHAEPDRDPRTRPDPERGAMTQDEAYEVLGLEPGAQAESIRRAHRELMKKLHPDQGGSTYLASRVNQAKDVLLNRHR